MNLTEFLLARILEDETAAHSCVLLDWPEGELIQRIEALGFVPWREHVDHLARHDPARVLAECAAKRYVVGSADLIAKRRGGSVECVASAVNARLMLAAMADVYADHPDYRDEWKP